jgi:hypothetical protein
MSTRTDILIARANRANLTRRPVTPAELDVILSPAYLAYVLGQAPRPAASN